MHNTKKDNNLELIRTVSIYLVVLIHFCNYYLNDVVPDFSLNYSAALLYNILARISVPLFFMISGALAFSKDFDFKKNNKKILHMVIVLIVWNLIYWFWDSLFLDRDMTTNIISYIFIPVKNHLWYMYAYIALLIANPLVSILAKNMKPVHENYFIAAWLLLCGGVRTLDFLMNYAGIDTELEYSIPIIQSTYYLGYYLCGHIIYKRLKKGADSGSSRAAKTLNHSVPLYISVSIIVLLLCFAATDVTSVKFTENMEKELFGYSNIMIMFPSLCMFIALLKIKVRESRLINVVGRLSFGTYLSHVLFYNIIYTLLDIRAMNSVIMLPLLSLATLIISLIFVALTSRIPGLGKILY